MNPVLLRREFLAALAASPAAAQSKPRIRVGCQTRAYGVPIKGRDKLLSILTELKAAGYAGFETNYTSVRDDFGDPAPLREEIRKRGVELIGLHMSARFTDAASVKEDRELIASVAKGTLGLGGKHVFVSGPGVPRNPDGTLVREALERRCEELDRAGKLCRQMGLRLSSHNHEKELDNNAEEMRAVLARTDAANVWILLDLAYVFVAGLQAPALIREIGSRVAAVHVRDMVGAKQEVLPGEGRIDYKATGEAMRAARWPGWAILEMNQRKDISSRDMVTMGRRYMKETMKI